jgi:hypothetical protein
MEQNNAERAKKGLPAFVFSPDAAKKEPKLWGEQLIHDYEETQVLWYWGKTPKPQPHAIADRQEIARKMMTIAVGYDDTEEYGWTRSMHHTDKQGGAPGRNELITAALGGRLQGRIEPHPHSMVVSWDNPDPDIARLVSQADDKSTRFNLFSFKSEPQKLIVRFWRVSEGEYIIKIGEDQNDDGLIDAGKSLSRQERLELGRFSTVELTVPPKKNTAVSLELVKAKKRPAFLPDLAVHPVKDIRQSGDKLTVRIHNIGDAPARNFAVEVLGVTGKVIDRKVIPSLAAPLDFVPKTVDVELSVPGQKWHKIVIDRANAVVEVFEGNNEALNALRPQS